MIVPTDQEVEDLLAYMKSLRPLPSPHLTADGKLTEAAARSRRGSPSGVRGVRPGGIDEFGWARAATDRMDHSPTEGK